jgi:MraZ protein
VFVGLNDKKIKVTQFLGEFDVTVDTKGRISFPVALRRQLSFEAQERFVMKKGFEDYIALYPMDEWKKVAAHISQLNPYIKKNRDFIRSFFKGVIEVELDSASRIQFPKRLLEAAGIERDMVLFAHGNSIEVWGAQKFEEMHQQMDADEMNALAEEVMGNFNQQPK